MHQLYKVIQDIDKTHPRLGNAVAFACLCVKAKQCLLVIAPAGCGKSSVSDAIMSVTSDTMKLDSVTRAGLRDFKDVFTHYQGLVVIDDLGKVETPYSRIATVTSFAELCYSHFISKHSFSVTVEIAEFHGSAIINIQPPILAQLVEADEWEVVTQDKTLRYYHLYRPVTPNSNKPEFKVDWGIDLSLVHKPRHDYKLYSKLADLCSIQWSDARVLEHLDTLLKSSAALERRQDITNDDFILLHKLMKPMSVERHCRSKRGFETGRSFDTNLLAVLVEFASWEDINVKRIGRDYKISESTVYRLLSDIKGWFEPEKSMSKLLKPTQALRNALKEAGAK